MYTRSIIFVLHFFRVQGAVTRPPARGTLFIFVKTSMQAFYETPGMNRLFLAQPACLGYL